MDKWEFFRWRRMLGYTQEETGEKLGVARGTIVNWERGTTRIPVSIDLACCELTRRWKQRHDFGPVNLVYADGLDTSRAPQLQSEVCSNNDAAIQRALKLSQNFINPMIIDDGGSVVWTASELLRECERRRDERRPPGHAPKSKRSQVKQLEPKPR